jgi:hypothetical protein
MTQPPANITPQVWAAAMQYAQSGAESLDTLDPILTTRNTMIFCRVDLSAAVEFRFFDLVSQSRYASNLERGRLAQGRCAVLDGFCFDVSIGRDVAGTAGPGEVLGTHEAAAADAADATEIASAYAAAAAKVDILRHGCIDLRIGTKQIFVDEFGLTRFPWPGGLNIDGPGPSLLGAYPATNNTKVGGVVVNNGLPSSQNVFPLVPAPIIHEHVQVVGRLYLPANPTIPAGYRLTAIMGFTAQLFGDANNT